MPSFLVFSTYVEMIPLDEIEALANEGILHVCGDDPKFPY